MVRDSTHGTGHGREGKIAGELCEKGLWREVLAFAQKWREENAADYRGLLLSGPGFDRVAQIFPGRGGLPAGAGDESGRFRGLERSGGIALRKLRRPERRPPMSGTGLENQSPPQTRLVESGHVERADGTATTRRWQCADRAVALDRKLVEAHLSRAAAARALGKMDIVQEVCRELATLEPEHFRRVS